MQMKELEFSDALPIDGYGPGFFRIGGEVIEGGVLVHAGGALKWDGMDDAAPLMALVGTIDVLFLGTGAEIAHPPTALRKALEEAGIGVEAMASPAAARTYNVLLSEGRRIAAALLPVGA
ncbi:hypothetical protein ACMU_17850 [Actibacterium mucosum KCTC 23349]|uniref:Uncharacterized protein n=1 Tax=Actibacterium mucosum KCTC 23349 TaxID=1454373 RepID=A0A037ZGB2_9RHOB|nr:Mth938-like domain-containing protein [Actibacterium mucosum]KAJ54571.1 hypothetical protein ACMU_17850 [Actibacterium mucosum KCTC 23349]